MACTKTIIFSFPLGDSRFPCQGSPGAQPFNVKMGDSGLMINCINDVADFNFS